MLEKQIQAKCLAYLKTVPKVWVMKSVVANRSGIPDMIACINGQFVAFEIKQERGEATTLQVWNGRQIEAAGGQWFVVNNFKQFKEIINQITGVNNVNQIIQVQ